MKIYLSVPFSEKDHAKSLGAKWDLENKKWYAPNGEQVLVDKWPGNDEPIHELIGEFPDFGGNTLFVDLVPRSCWFTNVRYCVNPSDWDRLRNFIYSRAKFKCECCNSQETLDAHCSSPH